MSRSLRLPLHPSLLRARVAAAAESPLSFWDQAALWACLACGVAALAPGAYLVPASSLGGATFAAAVGSGLGAGLIALAARAGARDRRGLGEFLDGVLGPGLAPFATALLFARNVLWMAFLLALTAEAGAHLLGAPTSTGVRVAAVLAFGLVALGFAAAGPRLLLPLLVKPILAPAALATVLIVALSSYMEMGVPEILRREPSGGWPNVWQGADLVALGALAWLPVAGSVSLHARSSAGATKAALAGFAVPTFVMALIGAIYVPVVAASESWELLTAVPLAVMAFVMLLTLETDGLVVLAYAGGTAAGPETPRRMLWTVAAVAMAAAIAANVAASGLDQLAFAAGLLFLPPVILHWRLGTEPPSGPPQRARAALLGAWVAGFVVAVWFFAGTTGPFRERCRSGFRDSRLATPSDRFGAALRRDPPRDRRDTWRPRANHPIAAQRGNAVKVNLVAAQTRLDIDRYRSFAAFRDSMSSLIDRACRATDPLLPSLIVLPEGLGLFLSIAPYYHDLIRSAHTVRSAVWRVGLREWPGFALTAARYRTAGLRTALLRHGLEARQAYYDTFAEIARREGVYIAAGSGFFPDVIQRPLKPARVAGRDVYNVAPLFSPSGALLLQSKKVHRASRWEHRFAFAEGRREDLYTARPPRARSACSSATTASATPTSNGWTRSAPRSWRCPPTTWPHGTRPCAERSSLRRMPGSTAVSRG